MDFLLPDDETVKKMCAEYACRINKNAGALGYINELNSTDNQSGVADIRLKESQNSQSGGAIDNPSGNKCGDDSADDSDNEPQGSRCNLINDNPHAMSQNDLQNNETANSALTRCAYACDICDIKVLFLYIVSLLRYNARYGTQIYDSDRGVGRVRSARCAFGSLNNLVSNNG